MNGYSGIAANKKTFILQLVKIQQFYIR